MVKSLHVNRDQGHKIIQVKIKICLHGHSHRALPYIIFLIVFLRVVLVDNLLFKSQLLRWWTANIILHGIMYHNSTWNIHNVCLLFFFSKQLTQHTKYKKDVSET